MVRGTVIRYDDSRGYGFVAPDGGGEDVFVHVNDMLGDEHDFTPGTVVEFEVARTDRGLKGYEVRILSEGAGDDHVSSNERPTTESARRASAEDGRQPTVDALRDELTEAWLQHLPELTGRQIIKLRECVIEIATSHGWIRD